MATKLYFHEALNIEPGTLPASNISVSATTPTQIGDSGANRSMNTIIGTSQTSKAITTGANTNAQPSLIVRFVSDRLAAQTFALTTIGDISLSIAGSESNANSNFLVRISLATWRPSTGLLVTRIHDLAANATSEPTTAETSLTSTNAAGGTSATVADGDVLVCEIWRDSTVQGNATARTNTVFYDGTTEASTTSNAAFINFPNDTLIFAPQEFSQAQAYIKQTRSVYGQSQAHIKNIQAAYGQAQTQILLVNRNYGQSQGNIKQIYSGYANSQADIDAIYNSYAQSQGSIVRTERSFGQSQTSIITSNTYHGQAQSTIVASYLLHAQAQTNIKQIYANYAQAQSSILTIQSVSAQAQGTILSTFNSYGQAEALIIVIGGSSTGHAQGGAIIGVTPVYPFIDEITIDDADYAVSVWNAPATAILEVQLNEENEPLYRQEHVIRVRAFRTGPSAQNLITKLIQGTTVIATTIVDLQSSPTTHEYALSPTEINSIYDYTDLRLRFETTTQDTQRVVITWVELQIPSGPTKIRRQFAQAQSQIISGNRLLIFSQANAYIQTKNYEFGQANAWIKQISQGFAQALASCIAPYTVSGQAKTTINATSSIYAQSQAILKTTYQQYSQSQSVIKATQKTFAQAQANIETVLISVAQAQSTIHAIANKFGNAQGLIKATINTYGQSAAYIRTREQKFGQAEAYISTKVRAYANALASILAAANVVGQAKADINATAFRVAQSQASIEQGVQQYAQAQTNINATNKEFGQAQASIQSGIIAYGNALAIIQQIYFQVAQAQAIVVKTTKVAQAQALITITHYLKKLVIADREAFRMVLTDHLVIVTNTDTSLIIVTTDSAIRTVLSDSGLRLVLTDKQYI